MALIRKQCAALPYRFLKGGQIELALVTSRGSGRWIIPKGWPMPGRTLAASAAREAFEEAGLSGRVVSLPIGKYRYSKRVIDGLSIPCEVSVFALRVERELRRWPEQTERIRKWFGQSEAAALMKEEELSKLLADPELPDRLRRLAAAEPQPTFAE